MTERGWGRIVAVGSSGVQQPLPNLAASNVGRAALAGYLKTLAAEVAGQGVTVNMVLPGRIDTERVAQLDEATAKRTGTSLEQARAASEATIPSGRYGTPGGVRCGRRVPGQRSRQLRHRGAGALRRRPGPPPLTHPFGGVLHAPCHHHRERP